MNKHWSIAQWVIVIGLSVMGIFPVRSLGAQGTSPVLSAKNEYIKKWVSDRVSQIKHLVTLHVQDSTLRYIIGEIARQAGLQPVYTSEAAFTKRVTVHVTEVTPSDAFGIVLKGTGLNAKLSPDGKTVVIRTADSNDIQRPRPILGSVKGVVIDSSSGRPVNGASVAIMNTRMMVRASPSGEFIFTRVPMGEITLVVKMLGYRTTTRVISITDSVPRTVRVLLASFPTTLAGMVTTATGVHRRVEVGNDITTINADSVMRYSPVTSMSDLLSTRVPGMNVALTSGAPGAPSKIRIRGLSSVTGSNDPIVIVDGIRMYSAQGNTGESGIVTSLNNYFTNGGVDRSTNMTTNSLGDGYLVPSAIDQIDPNIVEKVEILKGPSAVALYGTDAANGVILVQTKRGKPGPAKWSVSWNMGTQTMPGKWPTNYWMWGRKLETGNILGAVMQCTIAVAASNGCMVDSLMEYQILNDPHTTAFGRGSDQTYRGEVRGGTPTLTYALTGSAASTVGYLKMPDADVQMLESMGASVPGWQRRPQAMERQSANATFSANIGQHVTMNLTNIFGRTFQRSTPLQQAIGAAATLTPQQTVGTTETGSGLLPVIKTFRTRITSQNLSSTHAVSGEVQFDHWRISPTAGIDLVNRRDFSAIDRNACYNCPAASNLGQNNTAQGTALVTTTRVVGSRSASINRFLTIRTSVGGSYTRTATNDLKRMASDIPVGATSGNGAVTITTNEQVDDRATVGGFLETTIGIANRFYLPLAIRQDAGSGIGGSVKPKFPNLAFSYVVSDQPLFQKIPIIGKFMFRLRTSYGQSGIQPQNGVKLRMYNEGSTSIDGMTLPTLSMSSIGNAAVRPERTQELEGGVDIELLQSRIGLTLTGYQKRTRDALIHQELPASLGPASAIGTQLNIGRVRNSGFEVTLKTLVFDNRMATWNVEANLTNNRNRLVKLGQVAKEILNRNGSLQSSQRYSEGYPLSGRWARPILGYEDIDRDGSISESEIVLGDSSVFLGAPYANYLLNLNSTVTLLRVLRIGAVISYENGMNQLNSTVRSSQRRSRAINDPQTSLAAQAYMAGLSYTDIGIAQTVSTLRFATLSIGYTIPSVISQRLLNGKNISVSLEGKNLGLKTNYRGKDPSVSGTMNELVQDSGILPQPRTWFVSVRVY